MADFFKSSLIGRPGEARFPVSRDWKEIKCSRTSCVNYSLINPGFCGAPSKCEVTETGCKGFRAKETKKDIDGD